ncbi:TPA: YadA C-terminal domain-containing protein [Morganella morganii]
MQRGFAMSAATSNLFQPYNVGKFNLGAAVGGYNSENAVAVGSGYRFNENVAVKASLATSTSNGGDVNPVRKPFLRMAKWSPVMCRMTIMKHPLFYGNWTINHQ